MFSMRIPGRTRIPWAFKIRSSKDLLQLISLTFAGSTIQEHSLQFHGQPTFAPSNDFAVYLKPSVGAVLGAESALAIQRWSLAGQMCVQLGLKSSAVVGMNDVFKETAAFAAICSRVSEGSK